MGGLLDSLPVAHLKVVKLGTLHSPQVLSTCPDEETGERKGTQLKFSTKPVSWLLEFNFKKQGEEKKKTKVRNEFLLWFLRNKLTCIPSGLFLKGKKRFISLSLLNFTVFSWKGQRAGKRKAESIAGREMSLQHAIS